jgi:hypothetical protein
MNAFNNENENFANIEAFIRSDRVFEEVYESDSPIVIEETKRFKERAKIPQIFNETWRRLNSKTKFHAEIIGTFWHYFSIVAPQVMSLGAAKVGNNLMRHYIVQIIFEELGGRKYKMIHPDLFLDCLEQIGVTEAKREELLKKYLYAFPFDFLKSAMCAANTDARVLGILLGLEIDAEENIHTIYEALAHDNSARKIVDESLFFRIHKVVEEEHIRLDVANYLRFCPDPSDREEFMRGFDQGVLFWKMLWDEISKIIDKELIA